MDRQDSLPLTRATLYPLEPIALGSWDCESVNSYMRRLAFRHFVGYRPFKAFISEVGAQMSNELTAGGAKTLDMTVAALEAAAGRDDLHSCALLPFRNNFLLPIGGADGMGRYCPACIAESPFPEAWGRVLWDIPIVSTCPLHEVDLIFADCPFSLGRGCKSPPQLPGICVRCGSVSYKCSKDSVTPAAEKDLMIAQQIAVLVAAASGGKEFDRSVAAEAALSLLVDEFGSLLQAARFFRMNVNCLYRLGRSRLSVELLTTICATTGVKLASLLEGKIEYVYAPSDLFPRARRRTARDAELMLSLRHAVEQTPGTSVRAIARSLRVNRATLVAKFPELIAMIDKQVKKTEP
jgi:hypothetical protein